MSDQVEPAEVWVRTSRDDNGQRLVRIVDEDGEALENAQPHVGIPKMWWMRDGVVQYWPKIGLGCLVKSRIDGSHRRSEAECLEYERSRLRGDEN